MYYQQKSFENHLYVKNAVFSQRSPFGRPGDLLTQHRFQLLHGSQERVASETEEKNIELYTYPASPLDWLKSLVIQFEPSLEFGWLRPKLEVFMVAQTIIKTEKYINVIPCPEQFEKLERVVLERFDPCPVEIEPYDYLESTPMTKTESRQARIELDKRKKDACGYIFDLNNFKS